MSTISAPGEFPLCALCHTHVPVEICKTDESGQAVHESCYVSFVTRQKTSFSLSNPKRLLSARRFFGFGRWSRFLGLRKNQQVEMNSI